MNKPEIVGFTPNYIGFQKSRAIRYPMETWRALNELIKEGKNNEVFSKNCMEPRVIWTGSPDSNIKHLKRFIEPNKNIKTVEDILKVVEYSDWYKFPVVSFDDPREMQYATNYNPKANPGSMTSKLMEANNKASTVHASLCASFQLYKIIRKIPTMNNSLWDVFAREKDIKIEGKDEDVSTRLVLNTDEYVIHLLSWICNKTLAACRKVKDCKFHVSGEYDGKKAYALYNKVREYDWVIDADWTMFDSTIDTNYLQAACSIAFSHSAVTDEDKRMLFFVTSSIIYKNVAVPPGVVCRLNRGNPSGHPCVTLINCIVNMLRWSMIGYNIYGEDYKDFMDIEVYGDDAIVMFKDHKNLSNIDIICKKLGYESDALAPNLFPACEFGLDLENSPDFLKRRISPMGVQWNYDKILSRIMYQTKNRDVDEQIKVMLDFVCTAPSDEKFNELIFRTISFMSNNNKILDSTVKLIKDTVNKLEDIKKRFIFQTELSITGFHFEKSICGQTVAYYRPLYKEKYRVESKKMLNALLISGFSLDFINKHVVTKDESIKLFDIRMKSYYDFKFPREWLEKCLIYLGGIGNFLELMRGFEIFD